ncbi:UDP-2,3-diacylglucosamine hydrolase [Botrimarina colliarenosi]|uniref:UDP-2,3-diacylglucosamine hydrolase n=1 Tax=Botrimarina colliarenosi TaxID=2528001 RepID=A0A5C6AMM5_9BACT|nr:UDP-2,3-diacylglucosamine diphosphatase [Botrimarina colliarenosi]TWU00376.1 UDP-2,3-diacylglucosamine hydrolase [Botrimarina colliarenosi]
MFIESGSDLPTALLDPPATRPGGRPPVPPIVGPPIEASPRGARLHCPENRQVVRSLFVSDIHLGCRHSQAGALVDLLDRYQPEKLYIVGDFIDGWKLKNRWRWRPEYDAVLRRLMELKREGVELFYTPGNHDNFLRGFLANFGLIDIQDRFVHVAADGRRFVVTHGDQFDRVEQSAQWLSLVASYAYDGLLTLNWLGNRLRGKKHDPYAFCAGVKARVKRLVTHVSEFEGQLIADARGADCDGIICGHIHVPRIAELGDVAYLNTGDWVENCSALVENADGSFELVRGDGRVLDRLAARPAPASAPRPTAAAV